MTCPNDSIIMASDWDGLCPEDIIVCDLRNRSDNYVSEYLYTSSEQVMVTIVMPLIWLIGVAANLAFIFVVFRVRRMRTVTNYYLCNLAVADIMFLCFGVGDKLGRLLASPVYNDQYGLQAGGCILLNFFIQLSFYASLFLVTLVTMEKYYAVCHPVVHRLITGRVRTVKTVTVAWILAVIFAVCLIPAYIVYVPKCMLWPDSFKYLPKFIATCTPISSEMGNAKNGLQTIPFFSVMIANLIMYVLIIRSINTRVGVRERQQSMKTSRNIQIRNQVVRMLVINGVIFFACLAPMQSLSLFVMISRASHSMFDYQTVLQASWAGRILSYLNSACNPFVYAFVNPRYRQAFVDVFACCPGLKKKLKKRKDSRSSITNSNSYNMDRSANGNVNRQMSKESSRLTSVTSDQE